MKKILLIVDIHCDFKAKTNVAIFRCLPVHCCILV